LQKAIYAPPTKGERNDFKEGQYRFIRWRQRIIWHN
jgi:hypothetical protein